MTKRESILLYILINLSLLIFFILLLNSSLSTIRESENRTTKYTIQKKALENNSNSIKKELSKRESPFQIESMTIEKITSQVLKILSKTGIKIDKYQISKTSNFDVIELYFKCNPESLFNFIYYFNDDNYPYTIKNFTAKTQNKDLNVIVKISNEPCIILDNQRLLKKPYGISKLIDISYNEIKPIVKETEEEEKKEILITKTSDSYLFIGYITDSSGERFLYIKNKNGRIYKIKQADIIEDSDSSLVIKLGQELIKVKK